METCDLGSFGKVKLAGYAALIAGTANTAFSLVPLSEGEPSIGLLGIAVGVSLTAVGTGLIAATTIASFLSWSRIYVLTVFFGFAGSLLITGQLPRVGILPTLGLLIVGLTFNRMVKADVVTSKSLLVAKEKGLA